MKTRDSWLHRFWLIGIIDFTLYVSFIFEYNDIMSPIFPFIRIGIVVANIGLIQCLLCIIRKKTSTMQEKWNLLFFKEHNSFLVMKRFFSSLEYKNCFFFFSTFSLQQISKNRQNSLCNYYKEKRKYFAVVCYWCIFYNGCLFKLFFD